jgi:hypothetical protein
LVLPLILIPKINGDVIKQVSGIEINPVEISMVSQYLVTLALWV